MELYLQPTSQTSKLHYAAAIAAYMAKPEDERDAGLDAFCSEDLACMAGETQRLMLGASAAVWDSERNTFRAFWLLPRSSISKSPLRMANSVGLIDAGYRGILMGAVDVRSEFQVKQGDRYFQIAGPELLPWKAIRLVDKLPGGPTLRGAGGFGSTGSGTLDGGKN